MVLVSVAEAEAAAKLEAKRWPHSSLGHFLYQFLVLVLVLSLYGHHFHLPARANEIGREREKELDW